MGLPDFCNTFAIETEGKSMKTRIIMILLVGLMLISIGSTHAQETTPESIPSSGWTITGCTTRWTSPSPCPFIPTGDCSLT